MPPLSIHSITAIGRRARSVNLEAPFITPQVSTYIPIHTRSLHSSTTSRYPETPDAAKGKPASGTADVTDDAVDPKKGGKSFFGALFYGSAEAKAEGLTTSQGQHSKLVGRGKYVHEKITHAVKPDQRDAYISAASDYFKALKQRGQSELGGVKLTGSWETIVGSVGEFTHILEYEGYKGFDESWRAMKADQSLMKSHSAILKTLTSRQHQLLSEFSFWPSSPPRESGYPHGGIFEMRSYQLQPGKLLEWEGAWRRGLEARSKFVQPVGAFFAQVGQLHEVHHIWQYPDMETRKKTREQAWNVGGWSDTVQQTVKLAQSMHSAILIPCDWSPLR